MERALLIYKTAAFGDYLNSDGKVLSKMSCLRCPLPVVCVGLRVFVLETRMSRDCVCL